MDGAFEAFIGRLYSVIWCIASSLIKNIRFWKLFPENEGIKTYFIFRETQKNE